MLAGEVDNAYALVRPPGHHAERDWGRGYCMLANAPLAIMKARAELGCGRVAVVDWDVHHGNGTEQAFYDDPDTLTISLHQDRLYPTDTGLMPSTSGRVTGEGANINIPLPAGSGRGAYLAAFDQVVQPALRRFGPDLIVVTSGFDAGGLDPLGRMMLSAETFSELSRRVRVLAEQLCGGRLAMTHEGGYSELHAPFCGLRVLEELSGAYTGVRRPVRLHRRLRGAGARRRTRPRPSARSPPSTAWRAGRSESHGMQPTLAAPHVTCLEGSGRTSMVAMPASPATRRPWTTPG